MNKDQLNNASPSKAIEAMYRLVDAMDSSEPVARVMGPALFLLLYAEHLKVDVRAVLEVCEQVLRDENPLLVPLVRAARQYIQEELT